MREVRTNRPTRNRSKPRGEDAMPHGNLVMVGELLVAGLSLSACEYSRASAKSQREHRAQVKNIEGTEDTAVTLTKRSITAPSLETEDACCEKVKRKT